MLLLICLNASAFYPIFDKEEVAMGVHVPGYSFAPEPFMIPAILNLALITCMLIAGMTLSWAREAPREVSNLPHWWCVVTVVGMLYGLYPPLAGFAIFMFLVSMTLSLGGIPQAIVTLIMGVGAWFLFVRELTSNARREFNYGGVK